MTGLRWTSWAEEHPVEAQVEAEVDESELFVAVAELDVEVHEA